MPESEKDEKNPVVAAAEAAGAINEDELADRWANARTAEQVLGDRKIRFHPELGKIRFDELQGQTFLILQAQLVKEWRSAFGKSDFPLLMIEMSDGKRLTTAGSGVAILNQVQEFMRQRAFPVKVTLGKETAENSSLPYNVFK